VILVVAACGDGGGTGVFEGSSSTLTSGTDAGSVTSSGAVGTTTTTTNPLPEDGFAFIDFFEFDPNPTPPDVVVGAADFDTAHAIAGEFTAAGIDITGLEFWVFDVIGSNDRLLVIEANASAEDAASESDDGDLFGILRSSPTVAETGLTRLVINYRDSDAEGPYVLTMTMPLQELLDMGDDGDITAITEAQISRG
jgi:hypothetical protein